MSTNDTIQLGQGVILKRPKSMKFLYVCNATRVEKMDNFMFCCADMLGHPYGSAFQVIDRKRLKRIDPVLVEENCEEYEENVEKGEVTEDNRSIHDDASSQKLNKDDIEALREEGKSGDEILNMIVQNSATYQSRTEFSRAKYIQKKKKKYISQFVVLKPCTRLLSKLYFRKNPLKVLEMRPDTLAQMVTYANVHAHSNALVVDNAQGLVTGAILERMGSSGNLVQLYQGSYPVRVILEQFNFNPEQIKKVVSSYPLDRLAGLDELLKNDMPMTELLQCVLGRTKDANGRPLDETKQDKDVVESANSEKMDVTDSINVADTTSAKEETLQGKDEVSEERPAIGSKRKHEDTMTKKASVKFISREERIAETMRAMEQLRSRNFDTLVICSKYHPKALLNSLLPYLCAGGNFTVYSAHQEALMECYVTLREQNVTTNVQVSESWFRNLQVLPKRTHPEIVMSATGGYLLRGVKVENS